MTARKSAKPIPVPPEAVRTREQILDGTLILKGCVWEVCSNCNGTGAYPSSMIPPGQCRFYCWAKGKDFMDRPIPKDAGDPTYGRRPVLVEKYVRREQAADRSAYRGWVEAQAAEYEQAIRRAAQDQQVAEYLAGQPQVAADLAVVNGRFGESLRASLQQHGSLTERQVEALATAAARERDPGAHWGTVGKRDDVTVTVERVIEVGATRYGYHLQRRFLVAMRTVDGAALVWFTTDPYGLATYDREDDKMLAAGGRFTIRATVKDHGEYNGKPQTTVTRVTVQPSEVTA